MDYELAKHLKEAGFIQTGNGTRVVRPDAIVARRDDFAYVPTLEELIEACGAPLQLHTNDGMIWYATAAGIEVADDTSTTAVARLWLALNTK